MKTENRKIGEHNYTCRQMKAWTGLRVFTKLSRLLGSQITALISGIEFDEDGQPKWTELAERAAPLIAGVFRTLDENEINEIVADLFGDGCMMCDSLLGIEGRESDVMKAFDVHFSGRILHLLAVVKFALEVNFHDFFDVLPFKSGEIARGESESTKE
jgi:hypothetical protein